MREHHIFVRVRNFSTHWDQKEQLRYLAINGYDKTVHCYALGAIRDAINIVQLFGEDNIDGLLLDVCVRQMRDGLILHNISVIME